MTTKTFDFGGDVSPLPVFQAGFLAKGVKTWTGMDGYGYQFKLYYKGTKVALVTQDGRGGPTHIMWEVGKRGMNPKALEACTKLTEIAKATPDVAFGGAPLNVDVEWLMESIVDTSIMVTRCKKMVIFQGAKDEPGAYRTLKCAYSAEAQAFLDKKYPGAAVLNTQLGA